ncbi:membrane dipeptidase [Aquisphaera insulae]|uniref:membrane dipeptidase n=1 Tax=Aquisphaera insulae TaxID=2712864 RepID=UPI0013E9A08A|nr:membrane dipeptidase [Aquisphaera insulae]
MRRFSTTASGHGAKRRARSAGRILSAVLSLAIPAGGAIAGDDNQLDADAARIHRKVLVIDGHVDIPLDYGAGKHAPDVDGDTQVDLPKLERGGVDAAVFSVFAKQRRRTPEGLARAKADAEVKLKAINEIAAKHPDRAGIALTAEDVGRLHEQGKVAVIVGFLNGQPIGADLSQIDRLYRAGVRTFGFVHAGNNDLADSSRPLGDDRPNEHGGLSPLGRQAVERLNELGVIIDVSQLTRDAVLQTAKLSRAPVIASHSAVRALVDSPRNLTDAELDAIKSTRGVVHIVAFDYYLKSPRSGADAEIKRVLAKYTADARDLTEAQEEAYHKEIYAALPKEATVAHLVDAIDYAVKRIGIDHVGISSDFNHGGGVIGWNSEAEAANVTRELVRRGYGEEQIAKLWGGNFLRVFRDVESVARRSRTADAQIPRR